MEMGAGRARSAVAWVAAALVLVVAVGVAYLLPGRAVRAPGGSTGRVLQADSGGEALADLSFVDGRRGSVTVARSPLGFSADLASYVTFDGGATWRRGPHLSYLTARLVVQQADGGSSAERFSADGGLTWHALALPDPLAVVPGPPAFVDPVHGWWLLRAQGDPARSATVWRTDDGGSTWQRLPGTGIPPADIPSQLRFIDPLRGVLEAGPAEGTATLFVTGDGGLTWRPSLTLDSPLPGSPSVAVTLFAPGHRLLVWLFTNAPGRSSTVSGTYVLVSGDGGLTWSAPRAGPELQGATNRPALDDRGRLLVLEGRRLWISEDDGLTWTARVVQAPAALRPVGPFVAGRTLLALATSGRTIGGLHFADTLMRSTDGGAHWDLVRLP